MKIALTTSFIPGGKGLNLNIRESYPLGLGYIASVLENKGYEVAVYDWLHSKYSIGDIVNSILSGNPDIIGISVMTPGYNGAKRMANLIKSRGNIPIVLGGPHVSSFLKRTMEDSPDADFLIYGEGEFIFPLLIEAVLGKSSYFEVPQLCFRDSEGRVIINEQEHIIENLDEVPFPAWQLFNKKLYSANTYNLITSRGCSYGKCAFCMRTGLLYEKYRRRSVNNVIKELGILYKEFLCKEIIFFDDNFAQDERWVIDFCDRLIREKMNLKWYCNARVDTITEEMIEKMALAGCRVIRYGIESASQELLNYINKGISIQQIRHAIGTTQKSGIKAYGYFILALPRETPEIGRQTIQFAIDLDLDLAQFVPVRAVSGTKLQDLCKGEGEIAGCAEDFYNTDSSNTILVPKIRFVPKAYGNEKTVAKMIKSAYQKFYFRPRYVSKLLKYKEGKVGLRQFVKSLLLFLKIFFSKLD